MIVVAALVGMVVMAIGGLFQLRQSLLDERRAQISQLLDFADGQLRHFHALETGGQLSHADAQARAIESIAAQKREVTISSFAPCLMISLSTTLFPHEWARPILARK